MQGVSRRYRCLTRQPFTSGAGEFDRRDGFGCLSWGGWSLCAAEERGMPWYTGCACRASTDGRYICLNRECDGLSTLASLVDCVNIITANSLRWLLFCGLLNQQ